MDSLAGRESKNNYRDLLQEASRERLSSSTLAYLPPYLLEEMKKRGDNTAQETLDLTNDMRERRATAINPHVNEKSHGEREVYDAKFGYANPGNKARFEGEPNAGIEDVDKVYDYTGLVRDFYKKEFGRDSIDGQGMKVVSTVNYGENVQNAFWDGKQMFFGHPGPNSPFKSFVLLDVTGHEITHGITENESHLWQWDQAGALHEHFSDVFGEMIEQYYNHQSSNEADWLHGEGAFKQGIHGKAIRDMLNPGTAYDDPRLGKDPQPAHMKDYYNGTRDNGGVHINSGIPNRAFVLFAKAVGGNSWDDPGHIWFAARKAAGKNPTFAEFAYHTIEQAKSLGHADEVDKLTNAWEAVGVKPGLPGK